MARSLFLSRARETKQDGRRGPFKPGFGLSGVVLSMGKVFPLLVRVFALSTRTRSRFALHVRSRRDESCSMPNPRDARTIQPSRASTPASQKRPCWGPRIAANVAQLLYKLIVVSDVEIVVALCQKWFPPLKPTSGLSGPPSSPFPLGFLALFLNLRQILSRGAESPIPRKSMKSLQL
jgi:hypothetical protein